MWTWSCVCARARAYLSELIQLCTSKICSLLYINLISIKLFKKKQTTCRA